MELRTKTILALSRVITVVRKSVVVATVRSPEGRR